MTSINPMSYLNNSTTDGKYVMVYEKVSEIKPVIKGGEYILEGIFAFFGKENENGRIYEEAEYAPHLSYLQEKIKKNKLLGELDHPERFDVSLANASHIVEHLEMDKVNKVLRGRIRVLNTPKGEVLKNLINSGIPISISSRAAGLVESNKRVKIKKIFTYDAVIDPGFGDEAELSRIYESLNYNFLNDDKYTNISESLGINNTNLKVLQVTQDKESELKLIIENNQSMYITEDSFNGYTALIKTKLTELNEQIASIKTGTVDSEKEELKKTCEALAKKVEELETKLSQIDSYTDHLHENLQETVAKVEACEAYDMHLYENLKFEKGRAEANEQYIDHLYENVKFEKGRAEANEQYIDHLYENLSYEKGRNEINESYLNHIYENVKYEKGRNDVNEGYLNHLYESAKYTDGRISINESYVENYLKKATEAAINYSQDVANSIKEGAVTMTSPSNTTKINESLSIDERVNTILDTVKKQKTDSLVQSRNWNFFNLITESKQKEFLTLDETKKQKVVRALSEKSWATVNDIYRIWEESLIEHVDENRVWLAQMPAKFKNQWASLNESKKAEVIMKSKNYSFSNQYSIDWFWDNLNLDNNIGFIPLNENKGTQTTDAAFDLGYGPEYLSSIKNQLSGRFGKK
jgi:hypothetical protein